MITAIDIGSDMDLLYSGASVRSSGAYLNAGTCTWTLTDSTGATVAGGVASYVLASDGDYAGVMESTVTANLTADAPYTLTINFVKDAYNDRRVIPLRAAYRTAA